MRDIIGQLIAYDSLGALIAYIYQDKKTFLRLEKAEPHGGVDHAQ